MKTRVLFAVAVLSLVAPAVAAGQTTPVSVQGAVGSNVNVAGNTQSLSVGVGLGDRFDVVASAERIHLPTEVTRHEHGSSATRGGTTKFISGELRFSPVTLGRLSPYALVGAGRGTSRPNVNETFPDPVRHDDTTVIIGGGGARVALTRHLNAFADARFMFQIETSESGVFLFVPVRGGLAWRF